MKVENSINNQDKINQSDNFESPPNISVVKGNIRLGLAIGFPTIFYDMNYLSHGNSPKSIADHFIKQNKDVLGLNSDDELSDLHHYEIQNIFAGTTDRCQQWIYLEMNHLNPRFSAKEVIQQTRSGLGKVTTRKESKVSIDY